MPFTILRRLDCILETTRDVFENFEFAKQIDTLDKNNRLYLVGSKFAEVDLHPAVVPNAEMGDLFERRTALITAVVTGHIDIREAA